MSGGEHLSGGERYHTGVDVGGVVSEGSLRSIMKPSTLSEKDSSSPTVTRRRISFVDNVEHRRSDCVRCVL